MDMSKKVLCFGELLLRMSPKGNGEWLQQNNVATYVGGAELNVATALAKWEIPTQYFTALPDSSLSQDLISYLKEKQIDTSSIQISGNRIGLYYLPQGKDLKNAGVIYDRNNSSFSELKKGTINWDEILNEVDWLHLSAINPALNQEVADVCLELLKAASKKGITISLDLNYRAKLWKYGKEPVEIMPALAQYCDLIMGNIWAANKLLGIPLSEEFEKVSSNEKYLEQALITSEWIVKHFPKVKKVANTFRFDTSPNSIQYYGTLYSEGQLHVSDEINAASISDKIGSGDCFMAGLIYGSKNQWNADEILNFSAKAAVGKMYETSDATNQTVLSILANKESKMPKSQKSLDIILKQGILPLYFHPNREVSIQVLKALYAAGIRSVEYTNRGVEAEDNFKAMLAVRDSEMPDLQIGIGTIKTKSEAETYLALGADYLVSPGLIPAIAEVSIKANVLWIPGCMTVSEIMEAENLGCTFIKLFPGNLLGPTFMSSIKELFPNLKFMPTGGVELNVENMGAWFKSGVSAVGLGSKLITKEVLEQRNYAEIQLNTEKALTIAQSFLN